MQIVARTRKLGPACQKSTTFRLTPVTKVATHHHRWCSGHRVYAKHEGKTRIMPRIMHGHSFLPLSISLCCRSEVVVDDSPPRLFSLSRNGRFKLYASSSNPPNRSTRDAVSPVVTRAIAFLSIPGNGLSLLVSRKRENGKKQAAT